MDNHGIDPDFFLEEVHNLDYSIVSPNLKLAKNLENLNGKKFIFTNANFSINDSLKHVFLCHLILRINV